MYKILTQIHLNYKFKKTTLKNIHIHGLLAWNSSDCLESFSPLNNVWIDRPLMPSSDVIHYPKTG